MPNVSIVMTVFNGARFLNESIQSILNQSYSDFELIIIDNRSTDETPSIAKKFAALYDNVIYHNAEVNIPISTGLNRGFSLAKGKYWTKADCDNLYYPNAIEQMVSYLDTNPQVDFVYYDMEIINDQGLVVGYWKVCPADQIIYHNQVGCCLLYRASTARKVGVYSDKVTVCDYEYWLRFSRMAVMRPINQCLFQYRRHNNNLSKINEKNDVIEAKQLMKHYYPYFINTRRKAALFYAYMRAIDSENKWRQLYLFVILYYSPSVFLNLVWKRAIPEK